MTTVRRPGARLRRPGAGHRLVRRRCRRCPGKDLPRRFVYRTIDDVADLRAYVEALRAEHGPPAARCRGRRRPARPRGGRRAAGPRGRDARRRVRAAPDAAAGRRRAAARRCAGSSRSWASPCAPVRATIEDRRTPTGASPRMEFADGPALDADVVVFAAGVRPRDELARDAGLEVGERGGVVVDDACRTERPERLGDRRVRLHRGPLPRPGRARATRWPRSSPTGCSAARATFPGADTVHQAQAARRRRRQLRRRVRARRRARLEVVYADPVAGVYKKLVLSDDARTLLGGILVGDASAYAALRPMVGRALGGDPAAYLLPEGSAPAPAGDLPDDAAVCSCNNVTAGDDPLRGHRRAAAPTSPGSRRAPRPAPAAAPACRWSRSCVDHRAGRGPASRSARRCASTSTLSRAAAVRRRARARADARSARSSARHGTRPRLRHLQAGGRLDPGLARHRARARRRAGDACRTPTTTSWPTCRRTAPTRWCRASPAARSRRRG